MKVNADPVLDEIVGSYRQLLKTSDALHESLGHMLGAERSDPAVELPRLLEVMDQIDDTARELNDVRNRVLLLRADESIVH